jgi:Protein of unknown function (DUF3108)
VPRLPEELARARRKRISVLSACVSVAIVSLAHAEELKPYQATYNGIWHGMSVAVSNLKLEQTGDTWTYSSRSEGRGLGRFVSDMAPNQTSVVRVTATGVQPQSYQSGGSNSASASIELKYDWQAVRVTGNYQGTPVDLPLTPQVQDDGSVQLALMVELLAGRTPHSFQLIDKNSVREYKFAREGEATLKTPMGDVATVIYRSQKTYSPRITRFWCAPDRGYIPMKVEQKKGDDVQWTLQIQSLTRN